MVGSGNRRDGSRPDRSASSSDSSKVAAPTRRARSAASWSPTTSNSSGQKTRTMVAHEPAGTTTASAPASRSSTSASSVACATRAASGAKPAFQAGWPQHVWARLQVTSQPEARRSRTAALATSGATTSTTQVTSNETRTPPPYGRRRSAWSPRGAGPRPAWSPSGGRAPVGGVVRWRAMPSRPCLFCEIVAGRQTAHVVLDDEAHLAFLDVRPLFPGHTLLVPRHHVETLPELAPADLGPLFERAQRLARAMEAADGMAAAGSFVAMNNRISQSVPHLHIHVVPRNPKDGLRGFFWPRGRYADEADAASVAARLRDAVDSGQ